MQKTIAKPANLHPSGSASVSGGIFSPRAHICACSSVDRIRISYTDIRISMAFRSACGVIRPNCTDIRIPMAPRLPSATCGPPAKR